MRPIVLGTTRSPSSDFSAWRPETLGRLIADCFEITQPADRERASHWLILAALVCIAALVRFWNLGSVGLHGDEETMALAVRHILIDGQPVLPSGMYYPRGQTQLYLMALSVSLFGESEWALRVPSAVCGVALIPLAYFASRRFLRPMWSLAFAGALAFLPALVLDSQTARMYIFLVTLIAVSMSCVFAWERTDRTGWLVAAVAALIVGLDMHSLAVGAVLIFLLPGIVRGEPRRFVLGGVAVLVGVVAFLIIDGWVSAHYPKAAVDLAEGLPPRRQSSVQPLGFDLAVQVTLCVVALAAAILAWRIAQRVQVRAAKMGVAIALLAGLVLQLALCYHLAALCYIGATVLAARYRMGVKLRDASLFVGAIGCIFVFHVVLLMPTAETVVRLVGALVGQPSVWPYVRIAQLSPMAGSLTAALLVWGLYLLGQKRRVPDYWLLAVLGVWAPVFALGIFAWNVPPRYTAMSLIPMLLCAFAVAQRSADWLTSRVSERTAAALKASAAAIASVAIVNPASLAATFNAGYAIRPDHKGAAEFMRAQHLGDDDLVIAEDVLQQTYYLGRVDYWLIGPSFARKFVKRTESGIVDFYTGTPVIATPEMFEGVLRENQSKRIFVIGSGEDWRNGRRLVREELDTVLSSGRFATVFVGRDGRTRVLRAVDARAAAAAAERAAQTLEMPSEGAAPAGKSAERGESARDRDGVKPFAD
jgi:hypothetical protein